jgi:FkbM family methyltransferase
MINRKSICSRKISGNFYDYYLLKWGIRNQVTISLNTRPDKLKLGLSRSFINDNKSTIKLLFDLIRKSRLSYSASSNEFNIVTADGKRASSFKWDITAIEAIERALSFCESVVDYDADFLKIRVEGTDLFVRKKSFSDVYVVQENYAWGQYSFLYPYLAGSIVIDIGANIGDTAVLFCKKGAKIVHAYEPHPFFCGVAKKNIEINGFGDVITVHQAGVGAKQSVLCMSNDSISGPTGSFGRINKHETQAVEIGIDPFSSVIERSGDDLVVKMDCEGAELLAIPSCPVETLRKIKVMAVEFHGDPDPAIAHLKSAGFYTSEISRTGRIGLLSAVRKQ